MQVHKANKKAWMASWEVLSAIFIFIVTVGVSSNGHAQQAPGSQPMFVSGTTDSMQVPLYKSRIIQVRAPVKTVSVGNPEIADILILQPRQVYVVGKALGTTNVVLWDQNDRAVAAVDLEVTHDLDSLKTKLYDLFPQEKIEVRSSNGVVVLSGQVSGPSKMDAALKLASSFTPRGEKDKEGRVLNLMQVGGAQQVMLEVKVAEINRTVLKRLDINWNAFYPGSKWTLGGVSGGARFPDAIFEGLSGGDRIPIFPGSQPSGPALDEFAPDPLSITDKGLFASFLSQDFLFNSVIDAAKNNGLARILAEPTLTTLTGQQATFLSGGEFPIPVPRGDEGITIEFKEFGVGLGFLPVVLDSGNINLKVDVSVSQLSSAASIVVGQAGTETEFAVPSLTTRSSSSTVELSDGQTIAIAGLVNDSLREQINKFPGLGDVPILGMLFRSQEFQKDQTELVIFVTPRFARPVLPELVKLPTDAFVEPTDLEFYLLGRMEGARPQTYSQPTGGVQKGGPEGAFGHQL